MVCCFVDSVSSDSKTPCSGIEPDLLGNSSKRAHAFGLLLNSQYGLPNRSTIQHTHKAKCRLSGCLDSAAKPIPNQEGSCRVPLTVMPMSKRRSLAIAAGRFTAFSPSAGPAFVYPFVSDWFPHWHAGGHYNKWCFPFIWVPCDRKSLSRYRELLLLIDRLMVPFDALLRK